MARGTRRAAVLVLVATRKGAWIFHGDPSRRSWRADGPHFLVDPLDGTREFIDCNGEFTVNIAGIEGGSAVLGVVGVLALRAREEMGLAPEGEQPIVLFDAAPPLPPAAAQEAAPAAETEPFWQQWWKLLFPDS